METSQEVPEEDDEFLWNLILFEKLSFFQYQIMLDGRIGALFISDGADEILLPKEEWEKYLTVARRRGCNEHADLVERVLKTWPEKVVVNVLLFGHKTGYTT